MIYCSFGDEFKCICYWSMETAAIGVEEEKKKINDKGRVYVC